MEKKRMKADSIKISHSVTDFKKKKILLDSLRNYLVCCKFSHFQLEITVNYCWQLELINVFTNYSQFSVSAAK